MAWKESGECRLDYEDLVEELNQFEQDVVALRDRISGFIDNAKHVANKRTVCRVGTKAQESDNNRNNT